MNILDLTDMQDNEGISIIALLADKKALLTVAKKPYFNVTVQDKDSKISFPIWDDYEEMDKLLEVGKAYKISGSRSHYLEAVQIKNPYFVALTDDEVADTDFVPSYSKEDIEMSKRYLENVIETMGEPYRTVAKAATGCLGYNKERWNTFCSCVAAESHHQAKKGGLLIHSVGVLRNAEAIVNTYMYQPVTCDANGKIDANRLKLLAIVHDIAKPEEYDYATIIRYKPGKRVNHLVNSCVYMSKINDECGNLLTDEEMDEINYSILNHHGEFGEWKPNTKKIAPSIYDTLLHIADMIDAKVSSEVEK